MFSAGFIFFVVYPVGMVFGTLIGKPEGVKTGSYEGGKWGGYKVLVDHRSIVIIQSFFLE